MATTLYVGNRNYSSWSLRGSLIVRQSGLDCEEIVIPLDTKEGRASLRMVSPTHRVPVLHHEECIIWDSLAIAEYLHELLPESALWPRERPARAMARSISAEMHSGFTRLRERMPMDIRSRHKRENTDASISDDVARIQQVWTECRERFGRSGDYLFGDWCAADAMYAPVVTRFRTYGVTVTSQVQQYMDAVWRWPDMASLVAEASAEPWEIDLATHK